MCKLNSLRYRLPIAVAAVAISSLPALADSIDGDWCMGADHMHIEGASILTPGKNKIAGNYYRYRFTYIVPSNEPGAGGEVRMVMIRGTETVHLERPGGEAGKPEIWLRCKPVS